MFKEGNTMDENLMLVCVAVCAALLAGCDRMKEPVAAPKTEFSSAVSPLPPQISSTSAASKDGQAPIQGQVDPKEPAQRRAFETNKP